MTRRPLPSLLRRILDYARDRTGGFCGLGLGLGLTIPRRPPGGGGGGAVALTRTYRGLLAHRIANDAEVPFDNTEWASGSGVSNRSLVDGKIRVLFTDSSGYAGNRFNPTGVRSQRFLQLLLQQQAGGSCWFGGAAGVDGANPSTYIGCLMSRGRSPEATLLQSVASTTATNHLVDGHSVVKVAGTDYLVAVRHDGTALSGHDDDADNAVGPETANRGEGYAGLVGSQSGQTVDLAALYDMVDWIVEVRGLSTGQIARVRDAGGSTLASATESSGVASIDVSEVDVSEAADVAVYESDGTTLVVVGTPDDGIVAGGDIWDTSPGEFITTDGVWSWFADPRAVRYQGTHDRTYWGVVEAGGNIVVHSFDHDTGAVERGILNPGFEVDDHDVPVLRVRSDGKLQAFYSAHTGPTIRHRTTTNAEDITEWGAEQTYGSGTTFTYPAPADVPGKVILHWRQGNVSPQHVQYGESTDDGASFGASQQMISDHSPYHKFAVHPTNTDRIDYVVSNNHPESGATSLFHLYRDGDDWFDSAGNDIGDPPFALSEATTLWDAATEGESGWQWDITHDPATGHPVILFVRFPSTTDHRLMYAKWNGTSWDINEVEALGGTIATGGADPNYSAGAAIDPTNVNRVWLAIESSSGAVASIWEYITSDGGATWGTKTERTPGTSTLNARPFVPRGGRHDDLAVLFFRGTYVGFTDYDTVIDALGVS